MKVSGQYAEAHFADLLSAVGKGEEFEISAPGKPTVRLFLVPAPTPAKVGARRVLGAGRGLVTLPTDEE